MGLKRQSRPPGGGAGSAVVLGAGPRTYQLSVLPLSVVVPGPAVYGRYSWVVVLRRRVA
jgi:hypothetical protein